MLYYIHTEAQGRTNPLRIVKSSADTLEYPLDSRYDRFHSIIYDRGAAQGLEIEETIIDSEGVDNILAAYLVYYNRFTERYIIYDAKFQLKRTVIYSHRRLANSSPLHEHYDNDDNEQNVAAGRYEHLNPHITNSTVRALAIKLNKIDIIRGLPDVIEIDNSSTLYPVMANTLRELPFNHYYREYERFDLMKINDTLGLTLYITPARNVAIYPDITLSQFDYVWYSEVAPYSIADVSVITRIEDVSYLEDVTRDATIGDLIGYNNLMYQVTDIAAKRDEVSEKDTIILQAGNNRLIRTAFDTALAELVKKYPTPITMYKNNIQLLPRPIGLRYNQLLDQLDLTVEIFGYVDDSIGRWLTRYVDSNLFTDVFVVIKPE